MVSKKKKGLGKGLSALIPGEFHEQAILELGPGLTPEGSQVLQLDPRTIEPNPKQPRLHFDEETLQELAESIRRDGVREPVTVRKRGSAYQLVIGERRLRGAIMAGLKTVPALCHDVADNDMLRLGLIENIQREDLNPIEVARAYQALIAELGLTQEELANQVGKKRVTVTNTLRLLNLPEDVQERVADGSVSMGHARALLALETADAQRTACRKIIKEGLSVRQAEKLASPLKPRPKKGKPPKDPNLSAIEDDLRRRLGTRVTLRPTGNNRGKVEIEYFNLDDLDRILDVLRGKK